MAKKPFLQRKVKKSTAIALLTVEVIVCLIAFYIGVYQGMTVGPIKADSVCVDSDGGQNPNTKGIADGRVNGNGSAFTDACVGSNGGY